MKELIKEYKKLKKVGYKEIKDDMEIINLKKKVKIKELGDKIGDAAIDLVSKVVGISNEYEVLHKYSPEIFAARGSWSYTVTDNSVYVNYSDSWRGGGYCNETEIVTFDELINFNEEEFTQKCKYWKIDELKKKIESNTESIKEMRLKIKELQK